MNGRRARAQRATQQAKLHAALAAMNGATPDLIATADGQDFYMVGPVLIGVPVLRDDYPPTIKDAIDRRRRAGLTGRCDCGAVRQLTRKGRLEIHHEHDCTASDLRIEEIATEHGMTLQRHELAAGRGATEKDS